MSSIFYGITRATIAYVTLFAIVATVVSITALFASDAVKTAVSHPFYGFDPADNEALLTQTPNVFIGRVIGSGKNMMRGDDPATYYAVDVLENIKGEATGRVTLVQVGVGYRDGVLHVSHDDIESIEVSEGALTQEEVDRIFFRPGGVYVFAALYDPEKAEYGVSIAGFDRKLVAQGKNLSDAAAVALANQNSRVREFRAVVDILE